MIADFGSATLQESAALFPTKAKKAVSLRWAVEYYFQSYEQY